MKNIPKNIKSVPNIDLIRMFRVRFGKININVIATSLFLVTSFISIFASAKNGDIPYFYDFEALEKKAESGDFEAMVWLSRPLSFSYDFDKHIEATSEAASIVKEDYTEIFELALADDETAQFKIGFLRLSEYNWSSAGEMLCRSAKQGSFLAKIHLVAMFAELGGKGGEPEYWKASAYWSSQAYKQNSEYHTLWEHFSISLRDRLYRGFNMEYIYTEEQFLNVNSNMYYVNKCQEYTSSNSF